MAEKIPEFVTVTAFCANKTRFRTIPERSLQALIDSALMPLTDTPRFVSRGTWMATYAMPSGSVLEIYEQDAQKTGYLFLTLDTWLSYPHRMAID